MQGDGLKVVYRNQGAVSGDNAENLQEVLYLITGKTEVSIEEKVKVFEAPTKIDIPAKTYHKIVALTDLACILFEISRLRTLF